MKAILISAGQGTRLLPLTLKIPKCLVEVNGRAILDHQIAALRAAGIQQIVVIGGYHVDQISAHLSRSGESSKVDLIFNPFWSVASSIGSVWAARGCLEQPFCLLNGDTIFDAAVIQEALQEMRPGANLLVEPMSDLEQDDMRVQVEQRRVVAVSKDLSDQRTTHRSLGIVLSPDRDGGAYRKALETVIGRPKGHSAYHHAVIDLLAASPGVTAIEHHSGLWCEIDRPDDIERWVQDHNGKPMRRKKAK